MVGADQDISGSSAYPTAVKPSLVGKYPITSKSGAGYFYDDVLEYRVWLDPENGAERLNGRSDY
jgi:putative acetyltransferase